jgi:hypothetical protein
MSRWSCLPDVGGVDWLDDHSVQLAADLLATLMPFSCAQGMDAL